MALQDLRLARGWTQRDLSLASGVGSDVISTIETGRTRNPTWKTVRALALALETDPEALFADADETADSNASTAA